MEKTQVSYWWGEHIRPSPVFAHLSRADLAAFLRGQVADHRRLQHKQVVMCQQTARPRTQIRKGASCALQAQALLPVQDKN
jgi:hypothetical protein